MFKTGKNCSGSLTLEACIVVPIFIFFMLMVNGLFLFFMGQQMLSHALIQTAKVIALDSYENQRVKASNNATLEMLLDINNFIHKDDSYSSEDWLKNNSVLQERLKKGLKVYLGGANNKLLRMMGVEGGIDGIDFSESKYKKGILTLHLKYTQKFPLSVGNLTLIDRTMKISLKPFEYKK